jgi:hypothetical protein
MMRRSSNEFHDLCAAFGLMTLSWAWAENILASTMGVINKSAGPIKGFPEAPLSLKKKVSCLKIALRDISALQGLQNDGRVLAERFIELSLRRNKLVHGAAWQLHEGEFQSIGFAVQRGDYAAQNHRFNVSDAVLLESEIAKLSDDATAFLLRVCKTFDAL